MLTNNREIYLKSFNFFWKCKLFERAIHWLFSQTTTLLINWLLLFENYDEFTLYAYLLNLQNSLPQVKAFMVLTCLNTSPKLLIKFVASNWLVRKHLVINGVVSCKSHRCCIVRCWIGYLAWPDGDWKRRVNQKTGGLSSQLKSKGYSSIQFLLREFC